MKEIRERGRERLTKTGKNRHTGREKFSKLINQWRWNLDVERLDKGFLKAHAVVYESLILELTFWNLAAMLIKGRTRHKREWATERLSNTYIERKMEYERHLFGDFVSVALQLIRRRRDCMCVRGKLREMWRVSERNYLWKKGWVTREKMWRRREGKERKGGKEKIQYTEK